MPRTSSGLENRGHRIFYTTRDRGVLIQCDLIKYAISIRYTVLILLKVGARAAIFKSEIKSPFSCK